MQLNGGGGGGGDGGCAATIATRADNTNNTLDIMGGSDSLDRPPSTFSQLTFEHSRMLVVHQGKKNQDIKCFVSFVLSEKTRKMTFARGVQSCCVCICVCVCVCVCVTDECTRHGGSSQLTSVSGWDWKGQSEER